MAYSSLENIGTKQTLNRSMKKWPYLFVAPFLICYAAFFLYPIGYSFYISLLRWNVGEEQTFVGLKNYAALLTTDAYFLNSVWNTLILMIITIPLVIALGLILAELLFNENMKWRGFFQTANYLPYVTTPIAVAILFSLMFDPKIGVVNLALIKLGAIKEGIDWMTAPGYLQRTMLIAMIVWEWAGYYMLMYLAGMASIPLDVYEAAKVDGCTRIKLFFKITIPLLKNVTYFLVITSVIYMFQLLDQPYLLLRGLGQGAQRSIERPLMTVMTNFIEQSVQNGRLGYGAAITYALFVIILICTFVGLALTRKGEKHLER